jgi:beta-mannanase
MQSAIANIQLTTNQIKAQSDRIPAQPATTLDCQDARDEMIAAIQSLPMGLTASQVWSYVGRTLTQDPATFGPDVSNLASKADLDSIARHQYSNRMSTVFNSANGKQEVIVWSEKNGVRVYSADCVVTVKNSLGESKWSATAAAPNSDGVFRFENPLSAPISQNYYVVISAMVDGVERTTVQSFFTVV